MKGADFKDWDRDDLAAEVVKYVDRLENSNSRLRAVRKERGELLLKLRELVTSTRVVMRGDPSEEDYFHLIMAREDAADLIKEIDAR